VPIIDRALPTQNPNCGDFANTKPTPNELKQVPTLPVGTSRSAKRACLLTIWTSLFFNFEPFGSYTASAVQLKVC